MRSHLHEIACARKYFPRNINSGVRSLVGHPDRKTSFAHCVSGKEFASICRKRSLKAEAQQSTAPVWHTSAAHGSYTSYAANSVFGFSPNAEKIDPAGGRSRTVRSGCETENQFTNFVSLARVWREFRVLKTANFQPMNLSIFIPVKTFWIIYSYSRFITLMTSGWPCVAVCVLASVFEKFSGANLFLAPSRAGAECDTAAARANVKRH